jgi:hypothetical protein
MAHAPPPMQVVNILCFDGRGLLSATPLHFLTQHVPCMIAHCSAHASVKQLPILLQQQARTAPCADKGSEGMELAELGGCRTRFR